MLRPKRETSSTPTKKSKFRESVESLVFTIVFVWVFTSHIAQATEVPTESMQPTILPGDHFFLDKVGFPNNVPVSLQKYLPVRNVHRGEIIAFWSPENRQMRLVKRVIGLPGETVEVRNRDVYINGKKLDEPYAVHVDPNTYPPAPWVPQLLQKRDNFGPVVVPADHYFMMGDNRDNSNDSRFWGFAPREDFIGTPLFVYWSFASASTESPDWTMRDWVLHYEDIATHFFTKTRWLRTGSLPK